MNRIFILSLLLVSKALAAKYKFKFSQMAQGSVKNYENLPTKCIKEDFIATAPEIIAISSFDQRYPFQKFTSAFMVNAAAIHATSNKSIIALKEHSDQAIQEYQNNTFHTYLRKLQKCESFFVSNAYRSLSRGSLITAAFDKDLLRITQSGEVTLIVFRNSFNGEKPGSFLPVFSTFDFTINQRLAINS
jgi:hypothetical protein